MSSLGMSLNYVTIMSHVLCCLLEDVLGNRLSPLDWRDLSHFLALVLWPQYHTSVHVWKCPPETTCVHWYFSAGVLVARNCRNIHVIFLHPTSKNITLVMLLVSYVAVLCSLRTHNSSGREKKKKKALSIGIYSWELLFPGKSHSSMLYSHYCHFKPCYIYSEEYRGQKVPLECD